MDTYQLNIKTALDNAGLYHGIQVYERDGEIAVVYNNEEKPHLSQLVVYGDLKSCDDDLWKHYRISLVDYPYFKTQIQKLIKENEMWKEIYEKYKIRTS